VRTLTVAFLDRFSPKLAETLKTPKVKMRSLGQHRTTPLPYFAPIIPILDQKVLNIHANANNLLSALNERKLTKFLRCKGNRGGRT